MLDINMGIDTGSNIVGVVNNFLDTPVGNNNGLKKTVGVRMGIDAGTKNVSFVTDVKIY